MGDHGIAIDNEFSTDINLRNVYFQAAVLVNVDDGKIVTIAGRAGQWLRMPAWSFTMANSGGHLMVRHRNVTAGPDVLFASYPPAGEVAIASSPPSESLLWLHSWGNAATLPSWDGPAVIDLVLDLGATPEWVNATDNDGAKLQQAIDAAATRGHHWYGRPVFVPHGTFLLRNTVTLRNGTVLIGGGKHVATLSFPESASEWPQQAAPMLATVGCHGCAVFVSDIALFGIPRCRLADFQAATLLVRDFKTELNSSRGSAGFLKKAFPFVSFSGGAAGGKAYGLSLDHLDVDDDTPPEAGYSLLAVNGTAVDGAPGAGLHLYQTSVEHLAARQQLLIAGSSAVHFHSLKYESSDLTYVSHPAYRTGTLMRMEASRNVTVFGGSGNYGMLNTSMGGPGIFTVR